MIVCTFIVTIHVEEKLITLRVPTPITSPLGVFIERPVFCAFYLGISAGVVVIPAIVAIFFGSSYCVDVVVKTVVNIA